MSITSMQDFLQWSVHRDSSTKACNFENAHLLEVNVDGLDGDDSRWGEFHPIDMALRTANWKTSASTRKNACLNTSSGSCIV